MKIEQKKKSDRTNAFTWNSILKENLSCIVLLGSFSSLELSIGCLHTCQKDSRLLTTLNRTANIGSSYIGISLWFDQIFLVKLTLERNSQKDSGKPFIPCYQEKQTYPFDLLFDFSNSISMSTVGLECQMKV